MKVLLFLVLLPVLAGTHAQPPRPLKFTLDGDVTGVQPAPRVVRMSYMEAGVSREDSALVRGGRYRFSGTLAEPVMAFFMVLYHDDSVNQKLEYRRDFFSAVLEGGSLRLRSAGTFSNFDLQGAPAHRQWQLLQQQEQPYLAQLNALYLRADSLRKGGREAEAAAVAAEAEGVDKKKREEVYAAFIRKHPASPVALFALNAYAGYKMDPDAAAPLFAALHPKLRSGPAGTDFAQRLEGARRTRIGTPATDFTQADTAGRPVPLSSFRGQYVLVDFWASWCKPCREENPVLVKAFRQFRDRRFTVLGVALEQPGAREAWLRAIRKDSLTWTHVSDFKYFENAAARLYGISAIPRNLLIGPDGRILATDLRGDALLRKLEEVIR